MLGKNSLFLGRFSFRLQGPPPVSIMSYSTSSSNNGGTSAPPRKLFRRLPRSVVPRHYTVTLRIHINDHSFSGDEKVRLEFLEDSNEIMFHAHHDLSMKNCRMYIADNDPEVAKPLKMTTSVMDDDNDTVSIQFDQVFPKGTQTDFYIGFTGEISENLTGLYHAAYQRSSSAGEQHGCLVTQFCPADARRCFPCWDEPNFKATFDLSIATEPGLTVISNMPVRRVLPDTECEELQVTEFETSPKMSTYLLAIVIGEFSSVEATTEDGVKVRVYTPPRKEEHGRFALDTAVNCLTLYKNYFGVSYPLPKLDMIGVPEFSFGAMENWGLVVYREHRILVDPSTSSPFHRQEVAMVVAHEISHQWFGNLVTMDWWTHLWLNEGFATFMQYLAVDKVFPDYQVWSQFRYSTFISALGLDSLRSSHPVEVEVGAPEEVDQIFDQISYKKGASIIQMLYHYIGDENFRKGMALYLNRHAYGNTETVDLWAALEEASSKPVAEMMSRFTKQQGYPEVSVSGPVPVDEENMKLSLRQKRFLAYPQGGSEERMMTWMIPLTFSGTDLKVVMKDETMDVLAPINEGHWLKLNSGAIGFYHAHYENIFLRNSLDSIPSSLIQSLDSMDRLGFIYDVYLSVISRQTGSELLLDLISTFREDRSFVVRQMLSFIILKLNGLLEDDHAFRKFVRPLLSNLFQKHFGWEMKKSEGHLDCLTRSLLISDLASLGCEKVRKEAQSRFRGHVTRTAMIPAHLKSAVYASILQGPGNHECFEELLKMFRETQDPEDRNRIVETLGKVSDHKLQQQVLDLSLSSEIRKQDQPTMLASLCETKSGRLLVWNALNQKHQDFIKEYSGSAHRLGLVLKALSVWAVSPEEVAIAEEFLTQNIIPGTERASEQASETIKINVLWMNKERDRIKQWLAKPVVAQNQ